jgi:hypothetical protein
MSTLHPTEQALRLHRSHLATSHRAPLAPRPAGGARARATSFTPMVRAPHVGPAAAPQVENRADRADRADHTE